MLIVSLVLGIVLGLFAGGRIENLAFVRLRLVQLLFLGLILRYATQFAIENGNNIADAVRLPLFATGFLLLLIGLWANREHPGIALAFVGILLNAVAIVTNGGYMPVWQPSILAAGLPPTELGSAFHLIVGTATSGGITGDFLAQAGPLGDIIPIPIPFIRNVASIGDLFLASGLAFFLFATVVRDRAELSRGGDPTALARRLGQLHLTPAEAAAAEAAAMLETGALTPAADAARAFDSGPAFDAYDGSLVSAVALERPLSLGGPSVGSEGTLRRDRWRALPTVPPILERVRRHPYVRLALDSSFSALWTGQLISALGDRIHQVALAYLVFDGTRSPIAVGAVFLVATLPNLVFGPIAGGLVDRWDQREVMIVSDLLRAGLVLLIPIAAVTNLALAYPLVFLVTTVSIFFRPAKGAILPRMVAADDLVPANSALWIGETFADIGGYVLAGLFVALLGSQLPLAFWADAVTYLASALLIASVVVAPVTRQIAGAVGDAAAGAGRGVRGALAGFGGELREGWRFLRGDQVLLANTLQATAGQFMLGIFLVLTPVYAATSIDRGGLSDREAFAFMEGSIGAGNLIGGFLIGLVGARLALGRMVIAGYIATGLTVALLPLAGNLPLALGIAFGTGVGNLAFVIPSQTLFQKRTPPELMGRVLGLRFSVVFGAMTLAMGVGGVLGEWFGAGPVLGVFGLLTVVAGLAGLLVPAVRDA
jgi:MFS transporter, DHA3 family, macrolide efflux protein